MNATSSKKGIVLAGGSGSRLFPMTTYANKQLLPVYDKPMVYYPISTLMLGGVRDILIISGEDQIPLYRELLGDGSRLGVRFSYAVQTAPRGIAEAFLVGEDFLTSDEDCDGCVLVLGDNIFWGYLSFLRTALQQTRGATVFAYRVKDPERYGVVSFNEEGRATSLEEKPASPRSDFAVPGLYVYDREVVSIARSLKPSPRGELEITDLNRVYLERGELNVQVLGRGMAWLDTGTPDSLLDAAEFVAAIERRQGLKIGCLEECALRSGFVTKEDMARTLAGYPQSEYRSYVERLLQDG